MIKLLTSAVLSQPYPAIYNLLLAAWLVIFIAGMMAGQYNEDRSRRLTKWGRFGMVGITLAIGLLSWLGVSPGTYALLIFLGLLAGATGDVLLGDVIPLKQPIILGILAFGIGHGFYMAALFHLRAALSVHNITSLLITVAILVLIAIVVWVLIVRNPDVGPKLNYGSLVYAGLLFAVTGISANTTFQSGQMAVLLVGLVLFALSDIMLSQPLIRKKTFTATRDISFLIYSAGQVLIALSILAVP